MKTKLGYLEVIAGPMYCGKTEELIRQVKRATIGKKKVQVFKPDIDIRYGRAKKLYSHAGLTFDSEMIKSAKDILTLVTKDTDIVGIDEAQHMGEGLIAVVETLLSQGKQVIVTGLALTFDRQPFTPVPALMAMADKVTKLSAICMLCGSDAVYHKRVGIVKTKANALEPDPAFVAKLDDAVFEARCRACWDA
ncbi:MAG: thymidine kinase [Candidatus Gottesmanbacteria bacterium]|nr:thymidine kinase [Candidatus Gottesmanbacteria bacterium]